MENEVDNKVKTEMTFEQKKEALDAIVKDYGMGFMTVSEFIMQIVNLPWNEFERSLVVQTLDKCFEFKLDSFKIFLGLIKTT